MSLSIRSMAARVLASCSSVDMSGGCRTRDVAMSSQRDTGEEGVVNSRERVLGDVLRVA